MKVLVDSCVWSLALRRNKSPETSPEVIFALQRLIKQHRAVMIGSILQEVLSGIRHQNQFEKLRDTLEAFELIPIDRTTYIYAAKISNICRSKGVQGSHTDFLISAAALQYDVPIFTLDNDFTHYKKYLPLTLFADPANFP